MLSSATGDLYGSKPKLYFIKTLTTGELGRPTNHCQIAAGKKSPIPDYCRYLLIGEKLLQAKALAEAAAAFTLHSALDLDFFDINAIPESLRNEKLIRKHHILPLAKRHKTLFLAVVDPTDMTSVEDFEFNTGLNAEMIVVEFDKLHKAIDKLFDTTATDSFTDTQWDLAKMGLASGEEEDTKTVGSDSEDQPIISFINKMLHDAIRKGAQICILNLTKKVIASGFVLTVFCMRSPHRPWLYLPAYPPV